MSTESLPVASKPIGSEALANLASQYGITPAHIAGTLHGLYERHLLFDNGVDPAITNAREHYEAFARSVRDILSQRWVLTNRTYHRANPKRIYYLSMEFLIGRSLANNVTNLLLDPVLADVINQKDVDWLALLQKEPDAGLGNGGLGRLAACFLDSMATMQLPAMGYGLRYEYGIFKQTIQDGWQHEVPDNWLRHPDPWEVARPYARVVIKLNCSFILRDGALRAIAGRDSYLYGIPYDRPVSATAERVLIHFACGPRRHPIILIFRSSAAAISSERSRKHWRQSPSRGSCIRTIRPAWVRPCDSSRSTSWWRVLWPIWFAGSGMSTTIGMPSRTKWLFNLTIPTRQWRFRS